MLVAMGQLFSSKLVHLLDPVALQLLAIPRVERFLVNKAGCVAERRLEGQDVN